MNQSIQIIFIILIVNIATAAVTVNTITGISTKNLVFSGTIPLSSDNLFFTYYGVDGQTSQDNLKKSPLLIVVGSPGTSAQYYSLGGIGPMNLQNDMSLAQNPNRFTSSANVMFLDLLGSGFSFAADPNSLPTEAKGYGQQLTTALNTFIKESNLGQSQTIVLAGEGTFIRSLTGLDDIDTLKGIIHLSSWSELYAVGRYYGIAGIQLKLYGDSERIAIDATFTTCYNNIRSSKFYQAHLCLQAIYTFVEEKTKNANLFDTRLKSNFTQFLPMIQYYFSQSSVISHWKAPTSKLFETQSAYVFNKTYTDISKNYTTDLSRYFRDFFSVRHWFVQGQQDYISYYKGVRNWIQNQLSFVEKDAFKKASLQDIVVDQKIVGYAKAVKQVAYSELIQSGHHLFHDQPKVLSTLFKSWVASLNQEKRQMNISTQ